MRGDFLIINTITQFQRHINIPKMTESDLSNGEKQKHVVASDPPAGSQPLASDKQIQESKTVSKNSLSLS